MRILVTGSHGYIGSVLAPSLAGAGHEVVGLDTMLYAGCDFGEEHASVALLRTDVRDVVPRELEGFDAVVHLAALSNDPVGELDRELTFDINLEGTVTLARAAREAGVRRFVFASSCSMYGASGGDDLLDEDAPLRPLTVYAESKVRAEERLAALSGPDFVPVFMRNATVYGVSPRHRLDIVLNNLAGWAHTTGAIRLLSDGSAWRPLLHVRDLAAAALAVLEAPDDVVRGQAFNVGSADQNYLIRDLADVLAEVSGMCGRARRRRLARSALVPRRLREARAQLPPAAARVECAARGAGAGRRLPVAPLDGRPVRGAPVRPAAPPA